MRYRDSLKDTRNWALIEAGYDPKLPAKERAEALNRANQLYDEAVRELQEVEQEEEEEYTRHDRKYKRRWDSAA